MEAKEPPLLTGPTLSGSPRGLTEPPQPPQKGVLIKGEVHRLDPLSCVFSV